MLASGLSSFGDELALVALTIRVADLTDDGLSVAALLIVGILPLVVLAPFAGSLVDRTETTRTLLVVSVAQAGIALALAFTTPLPAILVLTFLLGVGAAIASPAVFALVPAVAGDEDVTKMNASMEIARYTGAVLGPVAAGLIASGSSVTVALIVNAVTFLVIAAAVATLRARRPPVPAVGAPRERLARAGFARIRRDPILLLCVVVITVMVMFATGDNVAEVFFASEILGAPGWGYGVLATAWMAGMVAGVMLIARRLESPALAPAILASGVVGGLAVVGASTMSLVVPAAMLFLVGGVANGVQNATMRNLIYHRVPERMHGRVFAAYLSLVNAMQIAATAFGGLLVVGVGPRWALLACGLGSAIVGAIGLAVFGSLSDRAKAPIDQPLDPWVIVGSTPPRPLEVTPPVEAEANGAAGQDGILGAGGLGRTCREGIGRLSSSRPCISRCTGAASGCDGEDAHAAGAAGRRGLLAPGGQGRVPRVRVSLRVRGRRSRSRVGAGPRDPARLHRRPVRMPYRRRDRRAARLGRGAEEPGVASRRPDRWWGVRRRSRDRVHRPGRSRGPDRRGANGRGGRRGSRSRRGARPDPPGALGRG